jgi:hypothetical protein
MAMTMLPAATPASTRTAVMTMDRVRRAGLRSNAASSSSMLG